MPGRFLPLMALMKETLRRGVLEMDVCERWKEGAKAFTKLGPRAFARQHMILCSCLSCNVVVGLLYLHLHFIREEQSIWTMSCMEKEGGES